MSTFGKTWSDAARAASATARSAGRLFSNKETRGEVMGAVGTAGGIAGTYTALQRIQQDKNKKPTPVIVHVAKDWAQFDRERGAGEKTGRFAGTVAGIAAAAHVGRRLARSGAVKRVARKLPGRAGLVAAGAYGAFQGTRSIGQYVGRKIDEATSHVFKADPLVGAGQSIPDLLNPNAAIGAGKPIPRTAQGMRQGRGRVNAGPGRWGGGPDIVKGYAARRASMILKGSVEQTMHEYKHGRLHSGSKKGPVVDSRAQAIAIAMHQAGLSHG